MDLSPSSAKKKLWAKGDDELFHTQYQVLRERLQHTHRPPIKLNIKSLKRCKL